MTKPPFEPMVNAWATDYRMIRFKFDGTGKARYVLGIDPDLDRNGYAWWDMTEQRYLDYGLIGMGEMLLRLQMLVPVSDLVAVVLSAGWLNQKASFHGPGYKTLAREKIAVDVGRNHGYGQVIELWCDMLGIACVPVRPQDSKWSPLLLKSITGIEETNQEMIDAMQCVYDRRTVPVRVTTKKRTR